MQEFEELLQADLTMSVCIKICRNYNTKDIKIKPLSKHDPIKNLSQ